MSYKHCTKCDADLSQATPEENLSYHGSQKCWNCDKEQDQDTNVEEYVLELIDDVRMLTNRVREMEDEISELQRNQPVSFI